jgi:glutamate synthase (NADPH/NADH) small chain
MTLTAEARGNSKYAWRDIARVLPSKRAAAQRVRDFREITRFYDEETVREQASRCLNCPTPNCREGCPLQNRIPEWLALSAEGRFLEAAELSRSTSNMPEICSRVCPQERLCEGACVLSGRSEPVCIGAVEKFINEYAFRHGAVSATRAPRKTGRVAVLGSGPAGLTCADELAKQGHAVTVFEAQNSAGGLLRNGIPAFKLEKEIVERRVNLIRQRGVVFCLGTRVSADLFTDLRRQFDAIFLGFGAQKAKALDIPGAELPGIFPALPFLIQDSDSGGESINVLGKRVAVLGGGDTAMDCLRTALRAGAAEAVCVYRRDLENMPGSRKEYINAIEEGARFEFLTNPIALEGCGGRLSGVRCVRMQLGKPDTQGRRVPCPVPGSEFFLRADVILVAYGFDPEPVEKVLAPPDLVADRWGVVEVDDNQMTSIPGVFSGGDLSRGASLVVHAVRDGRKAAEAIEQYLT